MKTAIILHGTMGNSESNWFQWLKAELEAKDIGMGTRPPKARVA